jgi:4-carboxymuconolactone decarboxylase
VNAVCWIGSEIFRRSIIMAAETPSPAQQLIGDVAPKLVQLTDDVLFGDVWERPGLSPRDRSLITVAALTALYRTGQLPSHLKRAIANGVTPDELVEMSTHLAFYAGWPNAMSAVTALKEVLAEQPPTEQPTTAHAG